MYQTTRWMLVMAIGTGAMAAALGARSPEDRVAVVVVKKGAHTLGVSVSAPDGKTQESVEPAVIAFTKAVLSKVP